MFSSAKGLRWAANKNAIESSAQSGFSLFELTLVICIIAIIFAFTFSKYQSNVDKSMKKYLYFQAGTFLRSIENIRALSVLKKTPFVDLDSGTTVAINRYGWPQAVISSNVKALAGLSESDCKNLLNELFTSPGSSKRGNASNILNSFSISLEENEICRYTLSRKQEGSYFFDYDLRNGSVNVVTP